MPGPTETEFFKRADMMDTSVGTAKKDDAAMVAETGWDAMMDDTGSVVAGWKNKIQAALSHYTPPRCSPRCTGRWPSRARQWPKPRAPSLRRGRGEGCEAGAGFKTLTQPSPARERAFPRRADPRATV